MMGIFGWSYPPGCSGTPFDNDIICDVCGMSDTDCICPECPECGDVGNPACYESHGLVRSLAQRDSLKSSEQRQRGADYCEYLDDENVKYAELETHRVK